MMRHAFTLALFLTFLFNVNFVIAAIQFPTLTGRIVDNADLLSEVSESELASLISSHESSTGEQIVIVTLKSLQGQDIADFGYQLGRYWGIGEKAKDNGVLFIIAPNERSLRIEVGYGVEDRLTDAASSIIINRIVLPQFHKAQYEEGIIDGTKAIVQVLGGAEFTETEISATEDTEHSLLPLLFILLILYILSRRRGRSSLIGPLIISSLLSGSINGRGGSIFRGGGGGFGGGGASGRW